MVVGPDLQHEDSIVLITLTQDHSDKYLCNINGTILFEICFYKQDEGQKIWVLLTQGWT